MKSKKLTKAEMHDAISQDGTLLPKLTSSICNMSYLVRVKNQLEYCPKMNEISNLQCLNPPKKEILLLIIQEELSIKGDERVVSFDEKHQPDVDWCLFAISALNPNHQIFDPNYKPTKSQKGRRGIRYIPKAEDFIFTSPNFSNITQNFNQYQKNYCKQNFKDQSKNVKFQQNHFDLSIDDMAPLQNNLNSKMFNQKHFEEEKEIQFNQNVPSNNDNYPFASKFRKSNTDFKNQNRDQNLNEKVGGLFQMLQTLENKGLLSELMQPYLEYYNSNERSKKNEFSQMIYMNNHSVQLDPQNSFSNQTQFKKKKKKSIHIELKRSASVHTSASSEARFQDFQGDQYIAHEKGKFCEALESKSLNRTSINKVDLGKKKTQLDVEMKIENISTITPAQQDFSIQNEIEGKINPIDEEIVYEENSQRYVDRKIVQQFNI